MNPCENCGAAMGELDRFCEACGTHVASPAAAPEAQRKVSVDMATETFRDESDRPATPAGPRDHQEYAPAAGPKELIDVGAVSDRGIRHYRNEDAADLRVTLTPQPSIVAVIADGVSSSVDPDAASALAAGVAAEEIVAGLGVLGVDPAPELVSALISSGVRHARSAVAGLAASDARASSSPACTIVLAVVVAGEVYLSWLGDSRAYWVPVAGPALPLTVDDSGAAEAIEAGIAPEVAYRLPQAHAITAWLGVDAPPIAPHLGRLPVELPTEGGCLVVCSDGLWNYLTDEVDFAEQVRLQAATSLAAGDGSALDLARRMVTFAITAGGSDNITVAVVPAAAIAATSERVPT